ncbi:hypothetical protein IW261DRAFT_1424536 [Armillaria novae-zelandiae]|uniref:CxC2-like cysteine cluster KDZ transposase-associated domain-containing protein n=1 Tax=Armillaria novae-zelandiae TaxID=153914 RepID=A0AA39NUN2_9AGAR|nr:hypothetical protein IW261DRAFT_1424536 [Armillaria novae-zelandiae]
MAVLCNPKPKVKWHRVGWTSHSIELYADTTDIHPVHRRHHHHSWSFADPSTARGYFHDLPELIPGSNDVDDNILAPHEEYHLNPKAYALAMAGDVEDIATAPQRHIYTYNPLIMFSSHVDGYVTESLRREGHGDAMSQRWKTILPACPTHIIQCWNGNYFDKVPLCELGLRYQVGHLTGEVCPHPWPAWGNHFTIINMNGIHDVTLDFCSCMQRHPFAMQLQGSWLFPATDTEPCTAITTVALEQFQMLTFMGKISAYEYYHLLDNFDAFICVVQEWSFVRQLKRAGVGNDGVWRAAKPGSCAVECLACPCPGVNMPACVDPDSPNAWESTLYIGIDANFYLERFNVSSEEKDPGSSKGLKTSTNESSNLRAHVVTTKLQKVIKEGPIEAEIWQPADQVKMDYGYLTTIRHFAGVPCIVTSYNIACQWSINLEDQIGIYGDIMQSNIPKKVYLVPKFHLPDHIKDCQEKYCMSFHRHVSENDGEAPEHSWAISNGVVASTREMGPGHRRKKLDQHFGDFNWQKNVSQGDTLLRKIKGTVPKASEHEDRFKHFTASLPQSDVAKWTKMVEVWEVDRNKPNLFAQTIASKTEATMRLQLAREDAQDEMARLDGDALHTTSPKGMISQGIQLESSQRRISHLNKELGPHSTDLQRVQVLEKANQLCRSVESWFVVQETHMPMV